MVKSCSAKETYISVTIVISLMVQWSTGIAEQEQPEISIIEKLRRQLTNNNEDYESKERKRHSKFTTTESNEDGSTSRSIFTIYTKHRKNRFNISHRFDDTRYDMVYSLLDSESPEIIIPKPSGQVRVANYYPVHVRPKSPPDEHKHIPGRTPATQSRIQSWDDIIQGNHQFRELVFKKSKRNHNMTKKILHTKRTTRTKSKNKTKKQGGNKGKTVAVNSYKYFINTTMKVPLKDHFKNISKAQTVIAKTEETESRRAGAGVDISLDYIAYWVDKLN